MKIIPIQPQGEDQRGIHGEGDAGSSIQNNDQTRRNFGYRGPSRRTFGLRGPSRRTFGYRGPSRRTFGRWTPSHRSF